VRRPAVVLLIAVFVSVVIAALGYFLLVGPKKGTIDKKQKEIEATENKIQTEKNTYRDLTDIKNRSAEYESKLASLQAKIPAQPELPSLIRTIQAAADPGTGAGLPWLSFAPGEVSGATVTQGQAGASYSNYTFKMTAAGFYDDVVDLVYRMERFPRSVIIDSIGITATTGILNVTYSANLGLVQADIGARTFTFSQPVGAAEQPTQTSAPKPQSK